MRRPILLILYAQATIILILYYLNPLGLGRILDGNSILIKSENQIVYAEGVVTKVQIKDYYNALTLDTGKEKTLVKLSGNIESARIYDLVGRRINVQGKVSLPDGRRNIGCFDYRLYLKGQNISSIIEVSKYRISAGRVERPLSHFLSLKKGQFYDALQPYMDEESFSVLSGLLFGDKGYMDDELYESFQKNGIAHVLAVSGLHVSLLYSVTEKLLRKSKSIPAAIFCLALVYSYSSLSGFSVSVIRASIMICLKISALYFRKRYDSVCAATLAAIILLAFRPYLIFDSGFQLSFAAAYSMGVALPYIRNKFLKLTNRKRSTFLYEAGNPLLAMTAAQIGMAPLIAFHFLNFSPVSLILNPIAVYLAGLILPFGLLCFVVSAITPGLIFGLSASPVNLFIKLLCLLNNLGTKSGLSFSVTAPPLHFMFLYYILFFYFFSETRIILNRRKKEKILALVAGCICIFTLVMPKGYNLPSLCFVDVGQGDCTLINTQGKHILIDGGGSYFKNIGKDTLKPFLLKNGISEIDLAIVTHKDMDHSKGIYELNDCFKIKKIYEKGTDNNDCTICSLNIDDINYLFMADADTAREQKLLASCPDLSCDIIKLGHHGSAGSTSENFIKQLKPSFALISCGKNNSYGHPAPRVLQLLENQGIIYGRTDLYGAIFVKSVHGNEIIFQNAAKDKTWHIVLNK